MTTEDVLAQYPVLFRGRRILVFDARNDPEFGMGHEFVLWDRVLVCDFGWADLQADGSLKGTVHYGPNELTIWGADFRELARDGLQTLKWALSH